jgi:hypothetical protein
MHDPSVRWLPFRGTRGSVGRRDLAGAARLELVSGVVLRERLVRRFGEFAGDYPWQWSPAHMDEWSLHLTAQEHLAPSTIRAYQCTLRQFTEFLVDARYGWGPACEEAFGPGQHPVASCHEWNTIAHLNDYAGDPEARPFNQIRALPAGITNRVEPLPPDSGRGYHHHAAGSCTFTGSGPCSGLDLSSSVLAPVLARMSRYDPAAPGIPASQDRPAPARNGMSRHLLIQSSKVNRIQEPTLNELMRRTACDGNPRSAPSLLAGMIAAQPLAVRYLEPGSELSPLLSARSLPASQPCRRRRAGPRPGNASDQ